MRNLAYLQKTVDDLAERKRYLPAFILKSQIVEYDLKRFLWQYCKLSGNCKEGFVTIEFLERSSFGRLYDKLSRIEDKFLKIDELAQMVKDFKEVRNEVIHALIISEKSPEEIENLCFKYLDKADKLLLATWGRLEAIEEFFEG